MGVKLKEIILRRKIEVSDLIGKIIAIDGPNIIMGLFSFARKDSEGNNSGLILDRTQRPISHLYGLLYRINFFYSKKIFPIFVFDGVDSELKKLKTKDRLHDFRFSQNWYQHAIMRGDKHLARQISLSREFMWQNIIKESKQLLGTLGVPYINSPASAESQCAQLVKDDVADYSNSQDFDSLLFGCPRLLQNLSKSLKKKLKGRWIYHKMDPLETNLKENLNKLHINQFQLVDMALLIGTDYFSGIEGIGPKTALKLIQKHHTIENILIKEKNKYNFKQLNLEICRKVRKIFLFPEVLKEYGEILWNYPNELQIYHLLCEEHNLNRERVKSNLAKFILNYEKCRLYFMSQHKKPRLQQKTLFEDF